MEVEAKQELNQELQKMKAQLNQSERRNDEGNKQLKALREELARVKQENEKLKFGGGENFLHVHNIGLWGKDFPGKGKQTLMKLHSKSRYF